MILPRLSAFEKPRLEFRSVERALRATMLSFTALPVLALAQAPVAKDVDGLTIPCSTGTVHLQVFSPRSIRVVAGPNVPTSYVTVARPLGSNWTWSSSAAEVRLRTSLLEARVNRRTGRVVFFDLKGHSILGEGARTLANGGVSQGFGLTRGEAIYGLGQHQQGLLDYRGSSVHLQQRNTEIAVPFLLSSKGYGVLWDNASITDVNVGTGDVSRFPDGLLHADDDRPGLTGHYYLGKDFAKLVFERVDPAVDFDWTQTPPPGLPRTGYSVRWTGTIEIAKSGTYGFNVSSDDGARLWIDGKPAFADWTERPERETASRVALSRGRHTIRLEFFQSGGESVVRFRWAPPGKEDEVRWRSEAAKAVDYTFLYGPEPDAIVAEYRRLTGPAPMLPRWAWGLWQSKERYQSQRELLDVVGEYRRRGFPLDGIIQDWRYWDPDRWGSHTLDPARFPDPSGMIRDLHAQNVHLLISVWGKFVSGIDNARALKEAGALYPQVANGEQYYDPFSPAGRRVYWSQIERKLFPYVDGWWLDASEPELGGRWGEYRDFTTAMGKGAELFNAYPLMHTEGVYQGQRAKTEDKRVVILTRSAYLGQQRNSAISWSGDINGTWDVFRSQIPAGIDFSLSGIPYWNTDIGGFFAPNRISPEYEELFTRWYQFGAFCPMFRVHGTNVAKEPWRFSEATQRTLLDFDRLRYHLLPYIYSTAWQVTNSGASMMRGLVLDFRNDPKALAVRDQYLFGPSLLVNPVTEARSTARPVYLPKGASWVDFWTGKRFAGGQTTLAAAPISEMPLFVRAGSILPYGPEVQSAADSPDPLEIRIYPGADGSFELYDDAGDGYAYERGERAVVPLHWNDRTRTLIVGARQGSYPGMASRRTFRIVVVTLGHGVGIPNSDKPDRTIEYDGREKAVRL